jgi:hypothetical protein
MADHWNYAQGGDKLGPFSARQLKDLAAAGRILPTDTVWKEGIDKGVLAANVKNLLPLNSPPWTRALTRPRYLVYRRTQPKAGRPSLIREQRRPPESCLPAERCFPKLR